LQWEAKAEKIERGKEGELKIEKRRPGIEPRWSVPARLNASFNKKEGTNMRRESQSFRKAMRVAYHVEGWTGLGREGGRWSHRGRAAMVLVAGLLALMPVASASLSPLPTPLHSGDSFSSFATTTPTLDGTLTAGEWDDADCATQTVTNDDGSTSDLRVCVKNDATNLYIAVVITNQDYSDPDEPCYDFINIRFDNDHDGVPEVGDNDWAVMLMYATKDENGFANG
jgi:hypothetical protein